MSALFASGRVLDFILFAMLAEAVALVLLFCARGRGVAPARLLPNLASGACLLLAMRLGLAGVWWGFVSLSLLGALAGHALDLHRQWK